LCFPHWQCANCNCYLGKLLLLNLSDDFFRRKTEEERQKKEDERARREFIKQEYMRRKQLKLMEEMDTVIKPRSLSIKQKKPRPKSIHRDHIESPKTPVKGPPGNPCSCGGRVCSC